ncbi:CRISPR-associated protein Cas4 [Bacillus cereus]|uniref:CRISPR-associated protein Cas4 n=1 Tax=Bacillus cereus TaxID=1396 RepID=UPI0018F7AF17|nr:CRISPR-associated protein Cas4 [Bacillus cereus]
MKITGTIVNYYFHCKRQCWLFSNKINLEDNSEDVRIGKILHELKNEKSKKKEIAIDSIRIDKLTNEYLIEIKKSDADIKAVKWQTLFYLKVLKDKGIKRSGKIQFMTKNKQTKNIIYVELTDVSERELREVLIEIQQYLEQNAPAEPIFKAKCKKCAYFEYCYI